MELLKKWYEHILWDKKNKAPLVLLNYFNLIKPDIYWKQRHREYKRIEYDNIKKSLLFVDENIEYIQSDNANNIDWWKIRIFTSLKNNILKSIFIKNLINNNIRYLNYNNLLLKWKNIFWIHFIRYNILPWKVSFASPRWLHKDDEEIVFVHLINKSTNLIWWENVLANSLDDISNVLNLDSFMDTIILTRKILHAVVPMWTSNDKTAFRDVIIFTVENKRLLNNKENLWKN